MPKLRVHNISMSLDGFAAGPAQDLEDPLGAGGEALHTWVFRTRTGRAMIGEEGGDEGVDDDFLRAGDENIGATVMGRNMFGPVRGPWPDESWRGWWGEEPPYHHDVFVLTHHPRADVPMRGGTTFHFVTDGIAAALERAFAAAGGRDVRLGGGVATIRQCLRAGLVDEMHVAVVPVLLGAGERLLGGDATEGYEVTGFVPTDAVAHYRFARSTGE
ncbi:dihydrofolate reductase family protein [Krasilnikovia sp. M28-CT-15]|uniref:dihydrofolate reductase family protein n=1 Tax=Krasilnikovia sp. M28-CT-15 TaxID=3373540 RepID=UPI0038762002